MKRFSDRNPAWLALAGAVVIIVVTLGALNLNRLPIINDTATYRADFANAGGLAPNQVVAIDGVRVGDIQKVALHGNYVQVTFTVNRSVSLGAATTAAAKVQTPLGTEYLALTPGGTGRLSGPIPLADTQVPYTLVGDLSQLSSQIEQYNIPQLVKALQTSTLTLDGTPTSVVAAALSGITRFSSILAQDHGQLAEIVNDGSQLAGILSQRSGELVDLVGQGDLVLQVLAQRQATIKQLLDGTAQLSVQIENLLGSKDSQLNTFMSNLQAVAAALSHESTSVNTAVPLLNSLMRYGANAVGSGPFADLMVPTGPIPDNLIEQCLKASAYPSPASIYGCRP